MPVWYLTKKLETDEIDTTDRLKIEADKPDKDKPMMMIGKTALCGTAPKDYRFGKKTDDDFISTCRVLYNIDVDSAEGVGRAIKEELEALHRNEEDERRLVVRLLVDFDVLQAVRKHVKIVAIFKNADEKIPDEIPSWMGTLQCACYQARHTVVDMTPTTETRTIFNVGRSDYAYFSNMHPENGKIKSYYDGRWLSDDNKLSQGHTTVLCLCEKYDKEESADIRIEAVKPYAEFQEQAVYGHTQPPTKTETRFALNCLNASSLQNSVALALANDITDVFGSSDDPNVEDMFMKMSYDIGNDNGRLHMADPYLECAIVEANKRIYIETLPLPLATLPNVILVKNVIVPYEKTSDLIPKIKTMSVPSSQELKQRYYNTLTSTFVGKDDQKVFLIGLVDASSRFLKHLATVFGDPKVKRLLDETFAPNDGILSVMCNHTRRYIMWTSIDSPPEDANKNFYADILSLPSTSGTCERKSLGSLESVDDLLSRNTDNGPLKIVKNPLKIVKNQDEYCFNFSENCLDAKSIDTASNFVGGVPLFAHDVVSAPRVRDYLRALERIPIRALNTFIESKSDDEAKNLYQNVRLYAQLFLWINDLTAARPKPQASIKDKEALKKMANYIDQRSVDQRSIKEYFKSINKKGNLPDAIEFCQTVLGDDYCKGLENRITWDGVEQSIAYQIGILNKADTDELPNTNHQHLADIQAKLKSIMFDVRETFNSKVTKLPLWIAGEGESTTTPLTQNVKGTTLRPDQVTVYNQWNNNKDPDVMHLVDANLFPTTNSANIRHLLPSTNNVLIFNFTKNNLKKLLETEEPMKWQIVAERLRPSSVTNATTLITRKSKYRLYMLNITYDEVKKYLERDSVEKAFVLMPEQPTRLPYPIGTLPAVRLEDRDASAVYMRDRGEIVGVVVLKKLQSHYASEDDYMRTFNGCAYEIMYEQWKNIAIESPVHVDKILQSYGVLPESTSDVKTALFDCVIQLLAHSQFCAVHRTKTSLGLSVGPTQRLHLSFVPRIKRATDALSHKTARRDLVDKPVLLSNTIYRILSVDVHSTFCKLLLSNQETIVLPRSKVFERDGRSSDHRASKAVSNIHLGKLPSALLSRRAHDFSEDLSVRVPFPSPIQKFQGNLLREKDNFEFVDLTEVQRYLKELERNDVQSQTPHQNRDLREMIYNPEAILIRCWGTPHRVLPIADDTGLPPETRQPTVFVVYDSYKDIKDDMELHDLIASSLRATKSEAKRCNLKSMVHMREGDYVRLKVETKWASLCNVDAHQTFSGFSQLAAFIQGKMTRSLKVNRVVDYVKIEYDETKKMMIFTVKKIKASGLQWVQVDAASHDQDQELINEELADALQRQKTTFTESEWKEFGIEHLRAEHFVRAKDGRYFKPFRGDAVSLHVSSKLARLLGSDESGKFAQYDDLNFSYFESKNPVIQHLTLPIGRRSFSYNFVKSTKSPTITPLCFLKATRNESGVHELIYEREEDSSMILIEQLRMDPDSILRCTDPSSTVESFWRNTVIDHDDFLLCKQTIGKSTLSLKDSSDSAWTESTPLFLNRIEVKNESSNIALEEEPETLTVVKTFNCGYQIETVSCLESQRARDYTDFQLSTFSSGRSSVVEVPPMVFEFMRMPSSNRKTLAECVSGVLNDQIRNIASTPPFLFYPVQSLDKESTPSLEGKAFSTNQPEIPDAPFEEFAITSDDDSPWSQELMKRAMSVGNVAPAFISLGCSWKRVVPSSPHAQNTRVYGLKWRNVGSQKPSKGNGLKNARLTSALKQGQLSFTQAQWNAFCDGGEDGDGGGYVGDKIELNSFVAIASGLKWRRRVVGEKRSAKGIELENVELARALGRGKLSFTQKQWDAFDIASGLKWRKVDAASHDQYQELSNEELADALQRQKTTFTESEWKEFDIKDLRTEHAVVDNNGHVFRPAERDLQANSFIKVGEAYFEPECEYFRPVSELSEALELRFKRSTTNRVWFKSFEIERLLHGIPLTKDYAINARDSKHLFVPCMRTLSSRVHLADAPIVDPQSSGFKLVPASLATTCGGEEVRSKRLNAHLSESSSEAHDDEDWPMLYENSWTVVQGKYYMPNVFPKEKRLKGYSFVLTGVSPIVGFEKEIERCGGKITTSFAYHSKLVPVCVRMYDHCDVYRWSSRHTSHTFDRYPGLVTTSSKFQEALKNDVLVIDPFDLWRAMRDPNLDSTSNGLRSLRAYVSNPCVLDGDHPATRNMPNIFNVGPIARLRLSTTLMSQMLKELYKNDSSNQNRLKHLPASVTSTLGTPSLQHMAHANDTMPIPREKIQTFEQELRTIFSPIEQPFTILGSYRRQKPTCGDIDVLFGVDNKEKFNRACKSLANRFGVGISYATEFNMLMLHDDRTPLTLDIANEFLVEAKDGNFESEMDRRSQRFYLDDDGTVRSKFALLAFRIAQTTATDTWEIIRPSKNADPLMKEHLCLSTDTLIEFVDRNNKTTLFWNRRRKSSIHRRIVFLDHGDSVRHAIVAWDQTRFCRLDLRWAPNNTSIHACMQLYFTGSKEFNKDMRRHANKMSMRLNEREISMNGVQKHVTSEEAIFKLLNLKFTPPEDRQNRVELQASATALERAETRLYRSAQGITTVNITYTSLDNVTQTIKIEMEHPPANASDRDLAEALHNRFELVVKMCDNIRFLIDNVWNCVFEQPLSVRAQYFGHDSVNKNPESADIIRLFLANNRVPKHHLNVEKTDADDTFKVSVRFAADISHEHELSDVEMNPLMNAVIETDFSTVPNEIVSENTIQDDNYCHVNIGTTFSFPYAAKGLKIRVGKTHCIEWSGRFVCFDTNPHAVQMMVTKQANRMIKEQSLRCDFSVDAQILGIFEITCNVNIDLEIESRFAEDDNFVQARTESGDQNEKKILIYINGRFTHTENSIKTVLEINDDNNGITVACIDRDVILVTLKIDMDYDSEEPPLQIRTTDLLKDTYLKRGHGEDIKFHKNRTIRTPVVHVENRIATDVSVSHASRVQGAIKQDDVNRQIVVRNGLLFVDDVLRAVRWMDQTVADCYGTITSVQPSPGGNVQIEQVGNLHTIHNPHSAFRATDDTLKRWYESMVRTMYGSVMS